MPEEKKTPKKEAPAYLVTFDEAPDLVGVVKAVKFVHGHGVLDAKAIGAARGDYLLKGTDELTAEGLTTLEALAEFWKKRGAKVELVPQAKADAYRAKLEKDPRGHLVEKPAPKPEDEDPKKGSKAKAVAGQAPPHKQPKKE